MKVAVIIPSLYEVDKDYLKLCVESLRATVDWQIIVVTNGSKGVPLLRGEIDGISVHKHTRDQGQCQAVNIGLQMVEPNTDYVLVSNSDMYYAPDWNRNLKFDFPVFSPNLVEPTDNPGSAAPFRKLEGGFTLDNFNQELVDSYVGDVTYALSTKPTQVGPGFNLPFFIRKDIFQTIGGYDEAYDPWGSNSDTDLQTKINLAGITPMRLEDVLVYHFSNKSGTFDGTHQDAWQKNWDYFDRKWGFNRDVLGSHVWYNKDMLPTDYDTCKYHPDWEMKYEDD